MRSLVVVVFALAACGGRSPSDVPGCDVGYCEDGAAGVLRGCVHFEQ